MHYEVVEDTECGRVLGCDVELDADRVVMQDDLWPPSAFCDNSVDVFFGSGIDRVNVPFVEIGHKELIESESFGESVLCILFEDPTFGLTGLAYDDLIRVVIDLHPVL